MREWILGSALLGDGGLCVSIQRDGAGQAVGVYSNAEVSFGGKKKQKQNKNAKVRFSCMFCVC